MQYGLIGRKLSHSFSPKIHKMIGGYDYGLIEVEPENLKKFFQEGNFEGINVTIPYKKEVMKHCGELSDISRATNSVNCIVRKSDGSYYGTNTDYFGFITLVKSAGIEVQGRKCLILGTGGVSGTVKKALEDMGAGEIVLISRSGNDNYRNIAKHYNGEIIVNTTPVGMYPRNEQTLLGLDAFANLRGVVDLIYNPLKTRLILEAEKRGIKAVGGLMMLVAQAAEAREIFTGCKVDDTTVFRVYKELRQELENIVIIGMPGSGKTTIGRVIGRKLGKHFVDVDRAIKKETGRDPKTIIREDGIDGFRNIETEVLGHVAKKVGRVLSTGGGVVEREENLQLLRQNSRILYLKRDLTELTTKGRPISQQIGLEELFERRRDLYESWSDYQVDNIGIEETAEIIRSILKNE